MRSNVARAFTRHEIDDRAHLASGSHQRADGPRKDGNIKTVAHLKGRAGGLADRFEHRSCLPNRIPTAFGPKPVDIQVVNAKFAAQVSALASAILIDEKQINQMPDWDKELLRETMAQARRLAK